MPDFLVNSEGVSFAMSFICGLSTMATLIEPPLDPPPPLSSSPPQPATPTPTNSAPINVARTVRRISPPSGRERPKSLGANSLIALGYVGCQALLGDQHTENQHWHFDSPLLIVGATWAPQHPFGSARTASPRSPAPGSPCRPTTARASSHRSCT